MEGGGLQGDEITMKSVLWRRRTSLFFFVGGGGGAGGLEHVVSYCYGSYPSGFFFVLWSYCRFVIIISSFISSVSKRCY